MNFASPRIGAAKWQPLFPNEFALRPGGLVGIEACMVASFGCWGWGKIKGNGEDWVGRGESERRLFSTHYAVVRCWEVVIVVGSLVSFFFPISLFFGCVIWNPSVYVRSSTLHFFLSIELREVPSFLFHQTRTHTYTRSFGIQLGLRGDE